MTSSRSYLLLLFTLLAITVAVASYDRSRRGAVEPTFLRAPSPQVAGLPPRNLMLDPAKRGTALREHGVHTPVRISAAAGGALFLVDDAKVAKLRAYRIDGNDVTSTVPGKDAPAFDSITDLAADDKRLVVTDMFGFTVHTLDRQSGTWSRTPLDREPYRAVPMGTAPDRLLVMRIGARWLFDVVAADGTVVDSRGDLLVDQAETALALDGFITRADDGVIFAGKHLGVLASFSDNGELEWLVALIGPYEPPAIVTAGNRRWVEKGALASSQPVTARGGLVCVLTRRIDSLSISSFVDVYDRQKGRHLRSLRLPGRHDWSSLTLSDDHLYVANRGGVYRWTTDVLHAEPALDPLSSGESVIAFANQEAAGR